MSKYQYADIIIPVALEGSFTYELGEYESASLDVGSRVIISFGRSRQVIGIIDRLHSEKPDYKVIKKVLGVPDYVPSISKLQLDFWRWISGYYLCTIGEVMDAALPSGLKLRADEKGSLSELRYKPRKEAYISLYKDFSEDEMNGLLDKLSKAPSRNKLLSTYLEETLFGEDKSVSLLRKDDLLIKTGVSSTTLNALVKEKIFKILYLEVEKLDDLKHNSISPLPLSKAQDVALKEIIGGFKNTDIVLLKGVTSSGKTELYIHLIQEQLNKGKQVLYLLPEIALTSQLINRLRNYFGEEIGVYHSRFSDNERVDVWRKTSPGYKGKPYRIILGVRSSLFLPFEDLGLIIVDEEHDASYKQKDPAPRYNARDSAMVLARHHGAKVLLGSATPSIESIYNCRKGKYVLVELNTRYGDVKMPEIEIADTREAYRRKIMISHFTPVLIKATEEALERKEQVVFFRNRRGYAPILICKDCGWTPMCEDCSVNMTYHKGVNKLKCHYCGKTTDLPARCGSCKSTDIAMKGFGTEKIEDEISILFPDHKVQRMDLDTTRKKGSLDRIITQIEQRKIDILVGTQMISKGLDFENLTLVGVLNVDNMLFFPDFRAGEKCFQLIEQVSGRAGRREKRGRVVLQSFDPTNDIIRQAVHHDYWAMYKSQIEERSEFGYPPYTRLITVFVRGRKQQHVSALAGKLAMSLRTSSLIKVLGPEFPAINRIKNNYIMSILIKIDRDSKELKRIKHFIKISIDHHLKEKISSDLRIYADVDPM